MNKKETKLKIAELLDAGSSKSEVFQTLSGGEVKDKQLAFFIASHAIPSLCRQHERKINALITIMFIQALFAALLGFGLGSKIGSTASWGFAAFCALIPLLFAYGFYKNNAGTYNVYLILTIIQSPRMFTGFSQAPISSSIGIAIGLAMLGYVIYVRSLLFPDFVFTSPKKIKGQYVFSS